MTTVVKYFSGNDEISSIRWISKTEADKLFPGIKCVRVDGYSVMAGWRPGHMQDADLVPVTRSIFYNTNPSLHKCDARCMHAKGRNCECSCGGKNHGVGSL